MAPVGELGQIAIRRPDPGDVLEYGQEPEARTRSLGDWIRTRRPGQSLMMTVTSVRSGATTTSSHRQAIGSDRRSEDA